VGVEEATVEKQSVIGEEHIAADFHRWTQIKQDNREFHEAT
jgi:hypothetical protein